MQLKFSHIRPCTTPAELAMSYCAYLNVVLVVDYRGNVKVNLNGRSSTFNELSHMAFLMT
jgi:hypothetical protein